MPVIHAVHCATAPCKTSAVRTARVMIDTVKEDGERTEAAAGRRRTGKRGRTDEIVVFIRYSALHQPREDAEAVMLWSRVQPLVRTTKVVNVLGESLVPCRT